MPKGASGERVNSSDSVLRRRLQWLLLLRLLLATFFLLLTIVLQSRREADLFSAQLQALYFFSCVLFLFTILAAFLLRSIGNLRRFSYINLVVDVGAVTVLIFLSGGVESLFSFLYMPVIISAALLLHYRGSLLTASLCSLAYGLLLDLQYFNWITPLQITAGNSSHGDIAVYFYSIVMNIIGFYLTAYLSGYLAEELHRSKQQVREQKRDLDQLEALHSNIVQSMSSGLLTVSSDGTVLFFNPAAQEILGLEPDQIFGRSIRTILPALDPLPWAEDASALLATSSPPELRRKEITYKRFSGDVLCLGYTVSLLQQGNGEASGWVLIFQDLTELKVMQEHLQRLERVAFAGRIAAEIAHEIKNPLASISGAVQMLHAEIGLDSVQSRLMGIVHREIDRINDLVTDFLWLSKGARKAEKIEVVPVCSAIEEVLALLRSKDKLAFSHHIHTHFEVSPCFSMDPHHFRQILWNLLVNAIEAMPEGGDVGISVNLVKSRKSDQKEVRIDIRDQGGGIAESVRDKVFEPFFTTKKSGTGLGLSIVYQLVENAGGRIELSHHEAAGTTFTLFFPTSSPFPLAN